MKPGIKCKCPYFEESTDACYCRASNPRKKVITPSDLQSFAPCTNERYRKCSVYLDWIYWKSRPKTDVAV